MERVFTASERELARVEGIGEKRAREIRRIIILTFTKKDFKAEELREKEIDVLAPEEL